MTILVDMAKANTESVRTFCRWGALANGLTAYADASIWSALNGDSLWAASQDGPYFFV